MVQRRNDWTRGSIAGSMVLGLALAGATLSSVSSQTAGRRTSTAPVSRPAPKVAPFDITAALRHLPKVALSVTDGVPEKNLFQKAIALSVVGRAQAPLRAEISATEHTMDAEAVTAHLDEEAARRATVVAASAAAAAAGSGVRYRSLLGEVQQTALGLYISGGVHQPTSLPASSPTELGLAKDYFQTVVSPQGILDARASALRDLQTATAARSAARSRAGLEATRARGLVAAEHRAARRLEAQLATSAGGNAGAVLADHQTLVAQEASELTRPSALQFTPAKPLPAPVSTIAVALTWAFGELGRNYLWGGTGPKAFDCSGLTQYVWEKAGVSIPRVAADQDAWTDPVPLSQLQPGDLVFYGTSHIHHVGIYIGGGLMINAPHTGTVVQVSSIWWSDLAGFGRVHADGTPTATHQLPTIRHPAPKVVKAKKPVPSETKPPAPKQARQHKKGRKGSPVTTTTTTPPLTVPAVTVPPTTVPPATVPAVTVPAVTVPTVTVPPVTAPPVTEPPTTTTTAPPASSTTLASPTTTGPPGGASGHEGP